MLLLTACKTIPLSIPTELTDAIPCQDILEIRSKQEGEIQNKVLLEAYIDCKASNIKLNNRLEQIKTISD
jgi:starvation-inducible outer membrane lipoprotein